jgi:uncharacterized Tic20 family protein
MAAEPAMSIATPAAQQPVPLPQPAFRPGRLYQGSLTESERNFSIAMHLSPLAACLFGPLIFAPIVLWIIRKDESEYNNDHGRETTNAVLSFLIYNVAAVLTVVGVIALPVLYVIAVINVIRGAVAAGRGEFFRYPITIRFFS